MTTIKKQAKAHNQMKLFKDMTAAEKRVMIAKDTIRWLDAKKIKTKTGTYLKLPYRAIKLKKADDRLDTALKTLNKPCNVCALGGMFYSMVRRFDKVTVEVVATDINDKYLSWMESDNIYEELSKYFPRHQLALIESAFEMRGMVDSSVYSYYQFNEKANFAMYRAINFSSKKNSGERLRAIMTNIIKNNGVFRP